MTIQYCKWCGKVIWHDVLNGFCCYQCMNEYEKLLIDEELLEAINN